MKELVDVWLTPGLWQMGVWSLQWALLIMFLIAWFAIRPPRTAAVRMLVSQMVLIAGLLLPLFPQFWGPASEQDGVAHMVHPPPSAKASPTISPVALRRPIGQLPNEVVSTGDLRRQQISSGDLPGGHLIVPANEPELLSSSEQLGWVRSFVLLLTAIWLIGLIVGSLRLVLGWRWLHRLRRHAKVVDDVKHRAEFDRCRNQLRVTRFVQLGAHSSIDSPILVGGRRPWILVPSQWEELSTIARRTILLHELTHVQRRDDFTIFMEELVRVCFFFHPMVHWLLACISADREELCDAAVVHQGVAPRELAGVLLECCRMSGAGRPVPSLRIVVLPFFWRRTVKDRIQTLMEEKSMSHWRLRPSRLSAVSLFVLTIGISVVVGGFGTRAADPGQPIVQPASAGKNADLPSPQEIQTAYRANIARLMPMAVTYRVLKSEGIACIEADRRRLRDSKIFRKVKRTDLKIDGQVYDEEQFALIVRDVAQTIEILTGRLKPEFVKRRLTQRIAERCYFWTDGKSFHGRWPQDVADKETLLAQGSVSPPENLSTVFGSIRMASWSTANDPPLRCWFGEGGGGRLSTALNDCFSTTSFVPLGFMRSDWTHKWDWHDLDHFMSEDPSRLHAVGRADLNGRSTIVVDGLFTDPAQNGMRERVRAWIDPNQGYLPLRLEWGYVDSTGKAKGAFHRDLEVLDVKKVADGYYPVRIKRQEYIHDYKASEKQRQEKAAGRLPEDTPPPPRAPGQTATWEVTEIVPHKTIEPAALTLEFPDGTLYTNAVSKRMYHAGDPKPLPLPPEPIQPGQIAPPLKIASWTDGGSRNLADFRGKVIVLALSERLDENNDGDADENEGGIAVMKGIQTKFAAKGVVFLEIYGAGSDIKKVREFQKATQWESLAGIDEGTKAAGGATVRKYSGGSTGGFVIVGRDGRVAFNFDALEEEAGMEIFYRAAKALSIPWPLAENGPVEQVNRHQLQILEFLISEQIDRALAQP